MTDAYTPVLATLGYVVSEDHVLMMRRDKRPDDVHYGKYNGLGGKLRPDEDVVTGLRREILEESGLVVGDPSLRGTISWPGFGRDGEGWFAFVFLVEDWHGDVHVDTDEGTPEWVDRERLPELPLWPSDHHFLPMVFDGDARPFHGCMPFANGVAVGWDFTR